MRYYLLPEEGKFYKANLHAHSTVSDGKNTPAQLKELYKSNGYSILAMTDHELLVEHSDLDDEDFLTLTAVEYAIVEKKSWLEAKTLEFNMFARDQHNTTQVCFSPTSVKHGEVWRVPEVKYVGETLKKSFDKEFMQRVIDEANANGFLISLNHPYCSFIDIEDVGELEGLFAMEIYNHDSYMCGYNEYSPNMYEQMLRRGKKLSCIAADDCHGNLPDSNVYCGRYGGWVMIKAKELKYDEVIGALERGDFYASTGPSIEELYVEDDTVHIKCSPAKEIAMLTCHRTFSGRKIAKEGEYFTEATFRFPKGQPYFRFDVIDERGHHANTRAYYPDSIQGDCQ